MKSKTVLVVLFAVLGAGGFYWLLKPKKDFSKFDALIDPGLSQRPRERMLVFHFQGDPNTAGKAAFRGLFKGYYQHAGQKEKRNIQPPRGRWPMDIAQKPKQDWSGSFAIPVSDSFPEIQAGNPRTEWWEYGDVAEILHRGPYSAEKVSIDCLMDFIRTGGYEIIGDHEEEYLRGPGMILKGNPDNYLTLIRYRVRKINSSQL